MTSDSGSHVFCAGNFCGVGSENFRCGFICQLLRKSCRPLLYMGIMWYVINGCRLKRIFGMKQYLILSSIKYFPKCNSSSSSSSSSSSKFTLSYSYPPNDNKKVQ